MGFAPWPYAATLPAVTDTYTRIQAHGDIVNQQLDGGVPWPEAFADQAVYQSAVEGDLSLRLANTDADMPVILSVCPLPLPKPAGSPKIWSSPLTASIFPAHPRGRPITFRNCFLKPTISTPCS